MTVDYFLIDAPGKVPAEFSAWETARQRHHEIFLKAVDAWTPELEAQRDPAEYLTLYYGAQSTLRAMSKVHTEAIRNKFLDGLAGWYTSEERRHSVGMPSSVRAALSSPFSSLSATFCENPCGSSACACATTSGVREMISCSNGSASSP